MKCARWTLIFLIFSLPTSVFAEDEWLTTINRFIYRFKPVNKIQAPLLPSNRVCNESSADASYRRNSLALPLSDPCYFDSAMLSLWINELTQKYIPAGRTGKTGPSSDAAVAIYRTNEFGHAVQVLYEKNAYVPQPVASVQKLLSAYLVYKLGVWEESVTLNSEDYDGGVGFAPKTVCGDRNLYFGEKLTMSRMVHTLLAESSNTAANALARRVSELGRGNFVTQLNQLAMQLLNQSGASSGVVANRLLFDLTDPSGLADNQMATAGLMARLTGSILADAGFREKLAGIRHVCPGIFSRVLDGEFVKNGRTTLAGITRIVRFPLPYPPECKGQGISMALFGEKTFDQLYRFDQFRNELEQRIDAELRSRRAGSHLIY